MGHDNALIVHDMAQNILYAILGKQSFTLSSDSVQSLRDK